MTDPIPLIVGVGASAGGLEAFQELLKHLGCSDRLAVVFVQHIGPASESLLSQLLAEATEMKVVELAGRTKLRAGHVYIAPAKQYMEIKNGAIKPIVPDTDQSPLVAIDHFFHSLADDLGERAIGVVLSGAGSDGTVGLKAISDSGGLTFAQDAASAKFDSMPRSAATTGVADHVCRPSEIATELLRYAAHLDEFGDQEVVEKIQKQIGEAISRITERLLSVTGHNFQHYKISTLTRRIQRRMQILKIATASEYLIHLHADEEESHALFRELLIGVTAFFRDPEAFDALRETVLPSIFENKGPDNMVRIWVAGCSTGEEAYSMAILCHEFCKTIEKPPEFQIFATDIDERALQTARAGTYPSGIEEQISPERLRTYFVKRGKRFQVTKQIREHVLFSKHNLISDPPFSRQDMISCRNLLIYLGAHLQEKLIPLFHYALRPSGFLFLGPSETISSHGELFRALDAKFRISQRKGTATGTLSPTAIRRGEVKPIHANANQPDEAVDLGIIRQRILLDEFAPKAVVIDQSGQVLNASDGIGKYLSVSGGDFQNNIVKMALSGLRIGLRAAINEATKTRRKVIHDNLSIRDNECIQRVMLTVQPMPQLGEQNELLLVVFHDVGEPMRREDDGTMPDSPTTGDGDADVIIAQMERELETTRNDLERTLQDMEAANEELKSSNEELLSMNEELQSANEELETSKEEIRTSGDMVARAHDDLENLLRSTRIATIFLDDNLNIRSFTPAATEIYGLIPTDIGRPLTQIVPNVLSMPPLPSAQTLRHSEIHETTVLTPTGRSFIRRVLPYQSQSSSTTGMVVTFTDVTELRESEARFRATFDNAAVGIAHVNLDGQWIAANARFCEIVGYDLDSLLQKNFMEITHPDEADEDAKQKERLAAGEIANYSLEKRYLRSDGQYIWTRLTVSLICDSAGQPIHFISVIEDIADRKRFESEILEREAKLASLMSSTAEGIYGIDLEGKCTFANEACARLLGYDHPDELLGQKMHELMHHTRPDGSSYSNDECHIYQAYRDGQRVHVDNELFWRSDGSSFPVEYWSHPQIRDGVTVGCVVAFIDITERKQRDQQLAGAKARLELSLHVADVAPWNWDMQANDLVSNPTLNRLFGFDKDATPVLADFIERMDDDVKQRVAAAIEHSMTTGETYDEEYPIRWPNGEIRHVRARGNVRHFEDGQARDFFGVVIDVTERKQRELDLAEREAHLRRVINNQLGLVGVIDRDGILLEVDDRSLEIARTCRDDVIGKHFADAPWWNYDPDVAKGIRDAMERAMAGEIVRYDVSLFAHGDEGVLIDFMIAPVKDEAGEIEYLIPSGVDIRERSRAERQQKEISRRMEMALRAGGMAAWEWTPNASFWTNQLYELLGIDPNLTPHSELFFSLVHPDDVDTLRAAWQQAIDGIDGYNCEFRIIRPDGQIRWMVGVGEVVRSQTGEVERMYGVNWDSTQEHEQAVALRESEQRAQAANASKSEFLANMSHEIRTPMTAILGYCELLKELVDSDEARHHLQTIRRNGNYLLEIINDILDLSKIEAGKFEVDRERFDPSRVIDDVHSIMELRAIEKDLTLEVNYSGKLPHFIESDAKRLKQILINLVGNAIKFTRKGRIQIRTHFESGANILSFDVIDTGIGMTKEQQQRLFKPFSQGDSSVSRHFGGTGLGLAISKRLAEMLGGNILVRSTEDVGSTFTVTIATGPVVDEQLVEHADGRDTDVSTEPKDEKPKDSIKLDCHVLIVDDRRDIRFLSKHILSKAGATVEECEDGQLAVEHIDKVIMTDKCPDLILLDMQMPNLDGYQTARKLRELGYVGPIIALTADAMQGDMNECIASGCNDYLSKPIDASRMLQLVCKFTTQ